MKKPCRDHSPLFQQRPSFFHRPGHGIDPARPFPLDSEFFLFTRECSAGTLHLETHDPAGVEDHEIRDAFPHSHPLQTRPARTEDFSGFRVNPLGAFFTGRRMKEHDAVLSKPSEPFNQRGVHDEFIIHVTCSFHSSSPQLGPEAASTSPLIGASGNSRVKAAVIVSATSCLISSTS
jgi:hypothetical protein